MTSELFAHKSFIQLWCARVCSTAGTQILMLALGWHMYELTANPWDLGLIGLCQFAPALLMALAAGHAADQFHRGRLAALCLALQAAVALVVVDATMQNWASRGVLLALSVVLGAIRPFQQSALQALVPLLVPPALLSRATAFASAGGQAAVIGGPALGGMIFVAGPVAVYAVCAVLFMVACVLMVTLRYGYVARLRQPVTMDTLLAGVRFIGANRVLLGAVSLDLFAVLLGGATALLPMFAKDILHVGPTELGLLRAAPGVGALIVAVMLARRPMERHVGRKLLGAVALFGVCMIVFGLSRNLWLSLGALAISGCADMVSVVVRQTLVQLETPDEMRGRVSAVNTLFIGASNQLGEFESGVTAALLGPVGSVVLGGLGTLAVALAWFRLFRPLATRDRLVPPP